MNQFHGCGSCLNHVYFNKEAVLQLWQISTSWVFQQGSNFYKSHKKVCIVRLNKINTLSTISKPSSSSVSRYCWNRGILWWKKGRIWGKYKSLWQNKAYFTERLQDCTYVASTSPPPSLSRTEVLRQSNLIGKWKRWKRNLQSLVNGKHSKGLWLTDKV